MEKRTWTAQEIAKAIGLNERSVQRRANKEGWLYVAIKCRGGRKKVFAHSGLPIPVQASLLKTYAPKKEAPKPKKGDICSEVLHEVFDRKSQKLKDQAAFRLDVVLAYHRMIKDGAPKTIAKHEVAAANSISPASLYRWARMCEGLDRGDWLAALAPGFVGRTSTTEISEEAWAFIKSDYLRQEQPALTACYQRLQEVARDKGWKIPSMKTFERRIKAIPLTIRVLLREGEKALAHMYPAQERDKTMLHANEWINGDGYKHNVFVNWPGIDKPVRPKTWFWQDIYSGMIMGYRIDLTENTDTIRLSFLDICDTYGRPRHVTIDNTRAAANKWMTGGVGTRFRFKIKDEDPLGIFPKCGVTVHWAIPGWGQSKPVERAFGVGGVGERCDKDPALAGAWCGNNPNAKPENYMSRAVDLETFRMAVARGVALINRMIRNTQVCAGKISAEQAFNESFKHVKRRDITPAQRRWMLLCAEAVTVQKDGTIKLTAGKGYGVGNNRYGCARHELMAHIGKKVVVRFDPQKLHEDVYCYALDGSYIAPAQCIFAAGFGDQQAAREHNRARAQFKKATKLAAKAEMAMTAIEAANLIPELTPPEPERSNVVELQFGQKDTRPEKEKIAVNQDYFSGLDKEPEEDFDADALFAAGMNKTKWEED